MNGNLVKRVKIFTEDCMIDSKNDICIGNECSGNNNFSGSIGSFNFYSKALAPEEI